jgi:hypothetical protein
VSCEELKSDLIFWVCNGYLLNSLVYFGGGGTLTSNNPIIAFELVTNNGFRFCFNPANKHDRSTVITSGANRFEGETYYKNN